MKAPAVLVKDTPAPEKSSNRSKDEVAEENDEVNDTTEKQVSGGRKKIQTYFPLPGKSRTNEENEEQKVEEAEQVTEEIPASLAEEVPEIEEAEQVTKEVSDTIVEIEEEQENPEMEEAPVLDVDGEARHTEGGEGDTDVGDIEYWKNNVCGSVEDSICHEVFVVAKGRVTFCSAAKVASATTKMYFYGVADGDLVIPEGARFGAHDANWIRFHMLDEEARRDVIKSPNWTHVFFWKKVLERFVSGYLDKVVHDCKVQDYIKPHLAIHHYVQYGFSCEEHTDLEAFISFMETVPSFEGHFHAQAPLCSLGKYPFTDMISADETLSDSLKALSEKLGVEHPMEDKSTSTHSTKAKAKMVALFKDRPHLIQRILDMYKVDCENIPGACNVDELMAAMGHERM